MVTETSNYRVAAVLSADLMLQFLGLRQIVSVSKYREEVHDCFDRRGLLDNMKIKVYSASKRRCYNRQKLKVNIEGLKGLARYVSLVPSLDSRRPFSFILALLHQPLILGTQVSKSRL